ncbi:hypothetical protein Tco_1403833 [Tanacetum coccineum]
MLSLLLLFSGRIMGFTKLHQLDTFYNALNPTDQDSLNAVAGGNLLTKTPRDALTIIENKSKVRNLRNKPVVSKVSANTSSSTTACPSEMATLTDAVNDMLCHVNTSPPEIVKAISENYVTCSGPHPYYECLAANGNTFNASAGAATKERDGYLIKTVSIKIKVIIKTEETISIKITRIIKHRLKMDLQTISRTT